MVEITKNVISISDVINGVRNDSSGGIITYIGLIRDNSYDKDVVSVEYSDVDGNAESKLQKIVDSAKGKWPVNDMAIVHRVGKLNVGDNNVVIAVSTGHRQEGFAACQYAIDKFKEELPTTKKETYVDGTCSDYMPK
ncbi:MAG: molybdenum cofactor biosynthesis protein MoaE [Dehalococcoidales bacterium]|nr:molybdenum cofactor biosynthesis protein MoaE [Dehalococcoidales bacterium]